jgi:hypothetical protein
MKGKRVVVVREMGQRRVTLDTVDGEHSQPRELMLQRSPTTRMSHRADQVSRHPAGTRLTGVQKCITRVRTSAVDVSHIGC